MLNKYLKYKYKYIELKKQLAGSNKKKYSGIMKYANGDEYSGDFLNNKKHGKGIMKYANGDEYSGDFLIDKKYGKGTMKYANGDV